MIPLVRLGLRSLRQHRLRSALSILGVVFGVAAVVATTSVGEGARREAVAQVGALGMDTLTVKARRGTPGATGPAGGDLYLRQADSVRAVVPGLLAVAPLREAPVTAAMAGRVVAATLVGTTPEYAAASQLRPRSGRFLVDLDLEENKRVAVLGASLADELSPFGDPRGETVKLGADWYRVVGVLEGRAAARARPGPIRSRDVNRCVFVPLRAVAATAPEGVDEIVVRVRDGEGVARTAEVVQSVVRRSSGRAAFDLLVPREILRQRERTQRVFNVVTGSIAAISLLVGGIGIMNIMLASVAERTREVGIRRAVGASQRDVAAQFLVEASLLTAAGGLLGALLGILGAELIQRLAGWPTALSVSMLLAGLLTALAVGVGFGSYPAWRASRLEPMEALRRD